MFSINSSSSSSGNKETSRSLISNKAERCPPFNYVTFYSNGLSMKKGQLIFLEGNIPYGSTQILSSFITCSGIVPNDDTIKIKVGIGSKLTNDPHFNTLPYQILNDFSVDVLNQSGIEGKGSFNSPIRSFGSSDSITVSFNSDISGGTIQVRLLFLTPIHN